jgi:hypothetical protein
MFRAQDQCRKMGWVLAQANVHIAAKNVMISLNYYMEKSASPN